MISAEAHANSHKQSTKPGLPLSVFSPEYYPESLSLPRVAPRATALIAL